MSNTDTRTHIFTWHHRDRPPIPDSVFDALLKHMRNIPLCRDYDLKLERNVTDRYGDVVDVVTLSPEARRYTHSVEHAQICANDFIAGVHAMAGPLRTATGEAELEALVLKRHKKFHTERLILKRKYFGLLERAFEGGYACRLEDEGVEYELRFMDTLFKRIDGDDRAHWCYQPEDPSIPKFVNYVLDTEAERACAPEDEKITALKNELEKLRATQPA